MKEKRLFLCSLFSALIATTLLFISGCEDPDANSLAQAQKCLNEIEVYTDAQKCSKYLKGVKSEQASLLRCSIALVSGGLTTTRMVNAFKNMDKTGGASEKEAYFMTALAMPSTDLADEAFALCKKSGVDSMIYIASLSRTGTYLSNTIPGLLTDIAADPENYDISQTDIDTAVSNCKNDAPECDKEAIGESIMALESVYCTEAKKDDDVCKKVNDAISGSDGSAASIAEQLFCILDKSC